MADHAHSRLADLLAVLHRSGRRARLANVLLAAAIASGASVGLAARSTPSTTRATRVFTPAADAFVEKAHRSRNRGAAARLATDTSPRRESYLRFAVTGLRGTVTSARLRLRVYDGTSDGPRLYATGATWSESGLTWSTRPARTSGVLGDTGALAAGTWAVYDVSTLVRGNGGFGFALVPMSSNGVDMHAREGARKPELVITTATAAAPDTTPPAAPAGLSVAPLGADEHRADLEPLRPTTSVSPATTSTAGATVAGTATQTSFTFTGLSCNTGYALGVRAVDGAGNVSRRSEVRASTRGCSAPSRPLTFPLRAAFYYPWFPETWSVNGAHVVYAPLLGYYSSSSRRTVDTHVRELDRAKVDVAIASWWGPRTHSEAMRIPLLLDRTTALGSPLRWAVYYEAEGSGNPSVAALQAQLSYLMTNYARRPEYARVAGKPVIFVFNAGDGCEVVDRWRQAAGERWYVSLKVFSGYRTCATQPDAWHQYSGATATDRQSGYSYTVSPGFWKADEPTPRLARDQERFRHDVRDMVASGEPWQLVVSFNEWGEGTAVEQAADWGSTYIDALASDGGSPPPPPPAE